MLSKVTLFVSRFAVYTLVKQKKLVRTTAAYFRLVCSEMSYSHFY